MHFFQRRRLRQNATRLCERQCKRRVNSDDSQAQCAACYSHDVSIIYEHNTCIHDDTAHVSTTFRTSCICDGSNTCLYYPHNTCALWWSDNYSIRMSCKLKLMKHKSRAHCPRTPEETGLGAARHPPPTSDLIVRAWSPDHTSRATRAMRLNKSDLTKTHESTTQ